MAKVSFVAAFKAMKSTSFSFKSYERKISTKDDGSKLELFTFTLVDPIEKVTSTNYEYDPSNGERLHPIVTDVTEITCSFENMEKYEDNFDFDYDEKTGKFPGPGSYEGDMILDLAKSSGVVWLTDIKFSTMSKNWKANKMAEKFAKLRDITINTK